MSVKLLLGLLGFVQLSPCFAENDNDIADKRELVSAIQAGISVGKSLAPFDLVGEFHSSDTFDGGVENSEKIKFRLHISPSTEVMVWASMVQDEKGIHLATVSRSLKIDGTILQGNEMTRTRDPGEVKTLAGDFERSLSKIGLPRPSHWGVYEFPTHAEEEDVLKELLRRIYSEDVDVVVTVKDSQVTYTLTRKHASGHVDVVRWVFSLPDMVPQMYRIDRSKDSPSHCVLEQELVWKMVQGKERPVSLIGSSILVRVLDEAKGKIEVGRREFDLQAVWLPMTDLTELKRFDSKSHVSRFIDEGFKQARFIQARGDD